MFRLTQYMREIIAPTPVRQRRGTGPVKPVVIWNLTRRCNLRCRHCYTTSADVNFPGELSTDQAKGVMRDLKEFGIPALILSGGEPMSRPDFFELAEYAKSLDFRYLALSTNGTKIDPDAANRIAALNFNYVGISLDGIGKMNDWFRGVDGAFNEALAGVRECKKHEVKVGLRFTITDDNSHMLEDMVDLCSYEDVDKFYLSHLVYAGRGDKHRGDDTEHDRTRRAMDILIDRAWTALTENQPLEIVTGNNDADAVWFLNWVRDNFEPEQVAHVQDHLEAWGGNSSGLGRGEYRPARSSASRHLLVRLHRWKCETDPVLRALDRRRPYAGHAAPAAAPAQGTLWRMSIQAGLWWKHPHSRPADLWRPLGRRPSLLPLQRRNRPGGQ